MRHLLAVLCVSMPALAQTYSFDTLVGPPGWAPFRDGVGEVARFSSASGLAHDGGLFVYVADSGNHVIRRLHLVTREVTTFAGRPGVPGRNDGADGQALFSGPTDVVYDGSGHLFVADNGNRTIRRIDLASRAVTTLSGQPGANSPVDGSLADARFANPHALAWDGVSLFVLDSDSVRRIDLIAGTVSTIPVDVATVSAMTASRPGELFIAGDGIRRLDVATGKTLVIRFEPATSLASDGSGTLYFTTADTLRAVDLATRASRRVAGRARRPGLDGSFGDLDGSLEAATFMNPSAMLALDNGTLLLCNLDSIRRVDVSHGSVTTLAGPGSTFRDGSLDTARIGSAGPAAAGPSRTLYLHDSGCLRILDPAAGSLRTIAGRPGLSDDLDGVGSAAGVVAYGLAVDAQGNAYVSGNQTVRRIDPTTGLVTTLAGRSTDSGFADGVGPLARFSSPRGLAVDDLGSLFVTDSHVIRRIDLASLEVTTIAGDPNAPGTADGVGSEARFRALVDVAFERGRRALLVLEPNRLRRFDLSTLRVTTLVEKLWDLFPGARVSASRLSIAPDGDALVVVGAGVLRVSADTGRVTLFAGSPLEPIGLDATSPFARFYYPTAAVEADGTIYVPQPQRITRGLPALPDAATVDFPHAPIGVPRRLVQSPATSSRISWTLVERPTSSAASFSDPETASVWLVPDVVGRYLVRLDVTAEAGTSRTYVELTAGPASFGCAPEDLYTLCFHGGRFAVRVDGGRAPHLDSGSLAGLRATQVSREAGVFSMSGINRYLEQASSVVKILDGRAVNGCFWVVYGSAGGARISVTDRQTGRFATYLTGEAPPTSGFDLQTFAADAGAARPVARDGALTVRTVLPDGVASMALASDGFVYALQRHTVVRLRVGPADRAPEPPEVVAGSEYPGNRDGAGRVAQFNGPRGLAADDNGNLYVADTYNHTIRRVRLWNLEVTTLAGRSGSSGSHDGVGDMALFSWPTGVVTDGDHLFVADNGNALVRRLDLATRKVTTVAGAPSEIGIADGVGSRARFTSPTGLAAVAGVLYLSDARSGAHASRIRRIDPRTGDVRTVAGGGAEGQDGPSAGFSPYVGSLEGDGRGGLLIVDACTVRRLDLASGVVSTVAGDGCSFSTLDGTGAFARFSYVQGLATSPPGVLISDTGSLRLATVAIPDSATIDRVAGPTGVARRLDATPRTAAAWTWSVVSSPSGSHAVPSPVTATAPTFTPDVEGRYLFRVDARSVAGSSITYVDLTAGPAGCGDPSVLCLVDSRYRVSVRREGGPSFATPISDLAGAFHFFDPDNPEVVVSMTSSRDYQTITYLGLSDVGYTITVTDTKTGKSKTYTNPPRTLTSGGEYF